MSFARERAICLIIVNRWSQIACQCSARSLARLSLVARRYTWPHKCAPAIKRTKYVNSWCVCQTEAATITRQSYYTLVYQLLSYPLEIWPYFCLPFGISLSLPGRLSAEQHNCTPYRRIANYYSTVISRGEFAGNPFPQDNKVAPAVRIRKRWASSSFFLFLCYFSLAYFWLDPFKLFPLSRAKRLRVEEAQDLSEDKMYSPSYKVLSCLYHYFNTLTSVFS